MKPIQTSAAPEAIGTYSQAIETGHLVFLSGQIPLCPRKMTLISDDIDEQIEQAFKNLSAVCEAAGGSLAKLAKLQVYLIDLAHFSKVNEAMMRHFKAPFPARAAIGVAALPKGAMVELDGIMVK